MVVRRVIASLLLSLAAAQAHAQLSNKPVMIVTQTGSVPKTITATVTAQCPSGYLPLTYSMVPQHTDAVIDVGHPYTDNRGSVVDLASLADPSVLSGGGFQATVIGAGGSSERFTVSVACVSPAAAAANASVSFVKQTTNVAAGQR